LGGGKTPTGQVVATVGDQEITQRELEAETPGLEKADPALRKAAQRRALNNIILRKILVKAANEEGVQKTPDFALRKQRADETVLVQAFQAKVTSQVPQPTPEEAVSYINDHPDIFAQRKIWVVDQIRMARPRDPNILKAYQPLKTIPDIEAQLNKDGLAYQRSSQKIDALGMDPSIAEQIAKLPAQEVFVMSSNNVLLINKIEQTEIQAFTGDTANQYALKLIRAQREQETVKRKFGEIVQKALPTVHYGKDFQPPKPVAGAPAPAPAS
jgi:EpsD family peptidyl-prolyl cis-trans isomerase